MPVPVFDDLRDRLAHIEDIAENRPGEALEELEAVTADLPDVLADRQADARALLRNGEFPGAAGCSPRARASSSGPRPCR